MERRKKIYNSLVTISFIVLLGIGYGGYLFHANSDNSFEANVEEDYPVWIEMMEQPAVEMKTVREAFDRYWDNHTHFKGDRSKQFERWYAINSKRLDQYGKVISADQVSSEFQKLRTKSAAVQQGAWFNYGPIGVGPRDGKKKDGGRVKDIEFHPTDPNTFWVSTFKGGLFKTTDYGVTWSPLTDNLTEQVFVCEVNANNTNEVFIGTDLGVYRSIDGGNSWENTSITTTTKALLIKNDEQHVVLAGSEDGIRRSNDGGQTWELVQSASKVEDLDLHPSNEEIIYASTNGNPSEFYRSEDGGLTWQKNTTFGKGCFMGIAVSPAQPDYVYVINLRDHMGDDSFEGFYLSEDSGISFTKQSGSSPCISGYKNDGAISRGQPNYNLFVCADPVDANVVYAGGVKSWKSTDKGKTWTYFFDEVTSEDGSLHLDQLNWAYSPHDNRIFAVNDGGVYYLNANNKFEMITDGLPIAEIYECTQSQTVKSNVAGGTMHCGVKLNNNGVWYTPWGGDEATCIIDPTDEKYVYHLKYEKISRSSNGGFNFARINSTSADRGNYTGTGTLHKDDPNTLFVGLLEVERTNNARDASVNWSKISSFGGSTKIQKIEQCSANHDVLYVARGSSFYRSDNVGKTTPSFTNLTSNLPVAGSVNDIATHSSNQNVVYILLGSKIYRSEDKGSSWSDISGNLPSVALLEMVYDNSSNEGIYVGTDIGVFYKDASMDSWADFSKNLPAVRVSGMDIYYGNNRDDSFITISTDGRGFWRSLLYGISSSAPQADFSVDKTNVVVGENVTFQNKSTEILVGTFVWKITGPVTGVRHEQNPVISFNEPGSYSVTLEVVNSAGTVTKSAEINVTQQTAPVAKLSAHKTEIVKDGIINFKDLSENMPTSWSWTFEGANPSASSEQNPVVSYNQSGTFDVTLTVTNSIGTHTATWPDYITVSENNGSGSLQLDYEFENSLVDGSSYKRDLAVVGDYTPVYVADRDGNASSAYDSPASNSNYLVTGYKGVGNNEKRTVTAWFKTGAGDPARKTIVSWGKNSEGQMFNVMLMDNGRIRVEAGSCNVQSTVEGLNDNQWHHVAIAFDPADGDKLKDIKIFVDGELTENRPDGTGNSYRSEDVSINTDINENNLRIGSVGYANYYWVGSLDGIRIYDDVLPSESIAELAGNITTGVHNIQDSSKIMTISGKGSITVVNNDYEAAKLNIYDVCGRKVKTGKLNPGYNNIALTRGVYIVSCELNKELYAQKAICY